MNKTSNNNVVPFQKATVTTPELQEMLSCGRVSALEIGNNAQARIQIGRRVLWNVKKINNYLDSIAE